MRAALEGFDNDPTDGADSYFAHKTVSPEWAKGLKGKVIGNHTFVRTKP
jgi:spore germination cell wall hydrolase CwlJ-like protein